MTPDPRGDARLPVTGCIILPAALFIALMLATAGTAVYPRVAHVGAMLVCGGEIDYVSRGASYRPGEYTVTRQIYCVTGTGKEAPRAEITWSAIGISFLIYAAFFFLLLRFVVAPWLRRRAARAMSAAGLPNLGGVMSQVQEAVRRGQARVVVREPVTAAPEDDGDPAERLAQLKALRDQGLITAADYEAKKAEILSRL